VNLNLGFLLNTQAALSAVRSSPHCLPSCCHGEE